MQNYNTQQRQILLDFFARHIDQCVSTVEVINELRERQISESAIYRNLLLLEKEGKLRRTSKIGDRKTYYQYIDNDDCKGQIHISCIKCGKTTHISPNVSKRLAKNLKDEDNFIIDNDETVIYGLCKKCGG